ncbi:hypothetical protein NDU88_012735 [Pleurodeles waltl]|uniref:Uncharacterized protein n=1 Tax=Pleurodeles waltl TaxID=8319 RepID=A0AAV7R431_PLEWA|nr:hypothetical protein NDU88_012735 [Pleurodeles waltl]
MLTTMPCGRGRHGAASVQRCRGCTWSSRTSWPQRLTAAAFWRVLASVKLGTFHVLPYQTRCCGLAVTLKYSVVLAPGRSPAPPRTRRAGAVVGREGSKVHVTAPQLCSLGDRAHVTLLGLGARERLLVRSCRECRIPGNVFIFSDAPSAASRTSLACPFSGKVQRKVSECKLLLVNQRLKAASPAQPPGSLSMAHLHIPQYNPKQDGYICTFCS